MTDHDDTTWPPFQIKMITLEEAKQMYPSHGECSECNCNLTKEESDYYGNKCEACEVEWNRRVWLWRFGAEDAEMDKVYDLPKGTPQ